MDEVRRQLHNEAIMEEMKRIEAEVKHTADSARSSLNAGIEQAAPPTPTIDPNLQNEPAPAGTADDRDHGDAGADERDHTDAGAEGDRDHSDAAGPGDDGSRRVTNG